VSITLIFIFIAAGVAEVTGTSMPGMPNNTGAGAGDEKDCSELHAGAGAGGGGGGGTDAWDSLAVAMRA